MVEEIDMVGMRERIPSNGLLDIIIDKLIEQRLFNFQHQGTRVGTECDKLEKELISLSNSIRDKMGSDQRLFMQYEELSTLNENAILRNTYKQGFIDGVELLKDILIEGKSMR